MEEVLQILKKVTLTLVGGGAAFLTFYRTYLRSQEEAASRLSISRTKQRLILVVA